MTNQDGLVFEGVRIGRFHIRAMITTAKRLTARRYGTTPVWALVADLTTYGSTSATQLCRALDIDPDQPCNGKGMRGFSCKKNSLTYPAKVGHDGKVEQKANLDK